MSTGILPSLWTPTELKSAQQQLLAQATSVNAGVTACTSLDAPTKAAWTTFFTQLTAFCNTSFGWLTTTNPDGSWSWGGGTGVTADAIEQYGRTLYAWQLKLSKTCSLGSPIVNPDANPGAAATTDIVKYAALGAAFLATAWAVSRVVSVLPRSAAVEEER